MEKKKNSISTGNREGVSAHRSTTPKNAFSLILSITYGGQVVFAHRLTTLTTAGGMIGFTDKVKTFI